MAGTVGEAQPFEVEREGQLLSGEVLAAADAQDAGPFVAAIEYASGQEALVVGKPSEAFFRLVLEGVGVSAEQAAIVGDDVETDVGGAMNAGLAGFLVRTGKYREDFVRESGIEPTATIDSIADLPGLLEG